jgi:uncharacterized protein (UPF0335 family)
MTDKTPGKGHNNPPEETGIGGIAAEALQQFIDRIEKLEEEKKAIADDIKVVCAQAKATGFDTKILRQVVRRRRMEAADREEFDQLVELYEGTIAGLLG